MFLGACRRRRRRGGLQLYQLRSAWGATGQLSGIWLGLWVSASGGAAQSASIFINVTLLLSWGVSGPPPYASVFVPDVRCLQGHAPKAMRKTLWTCVAGPRLSRGCGGAFLVRPPFFLTLCTTLGTASRVFFLESSIHTCPMTCPSATQLGLEGEANGTTGVGGALEAVLLINSFYHRTNHTGGSSNKRSV